LRKGGEWWCKLKAGVSIKKTYGKLHRRESRLDLGEKAEQQVDTRRKIEKSCPKGCFK
jgi:hypothetical protein